MTAKDGGVLLPIIGLPTSPFQQVHTPAGSSLRGWRLTASPDALPQARACPGGASPPRRSVACDLLQPARCLGRNSVVGRCADRSWDLVAARSVSRVTVDSGQD